MALGRKVLAYWLTAGIAAIVVAVIAKWPFTSPRTVAGSISDCSGPLQSVTVQLKSPAGQTLAQATTDSRGEFTLLTADSGEMLIDISHPGYAEYTSRLPASSERQTIQLKQLPVSFGIGEGKRLDEALALVAAKLNVTARFSARCSIAAQHAALSAVGLTHDTPCDLKATLKKLLDRVSVTTFRYEVTELEHGRLYEVDCFGR